MRRILAKTIVAAALTVLLVAAAQAEVIDRIVATVNGHIILQSDWDDALRYEALLNGRAPTSSPQTIAAPYSIA